MPGNALPSHETLQNVIGMYYQERWQEDGQKLLDESELLLWQAKETNDKDKMDAAFELEKQARDLERYPPNPDQVTKLVASIGRTGFWNNLVVRPHPEREGRYQLAYGHYRLEESIALDGFPVRRERVEFNQINLPIEIVLNDGTPPQVADNTAGGLKP